MLPSLRSILGFLAPQGVLKLALLLRLLLLMLLLPWLLPRRLLSRDKLL